MILAPSLRDTDALLPAPATAAGWEANGGAPPAPARPVSLLGVAFDPVTKAGAVARIEAMIATRQPHYVITANVDFLVQARRDVELRRVLLEADLVLCDGAPLLWASRWLGNPLPERAAGADLVPLLVRAAAQRGHRLFLLGPGPEVAAEAAARLQQMHPALMIAGHYSPPVRDLLEMDWPEIARRVSAARPDVLLVSFGCPKQEKWIALHYHLLGVPVMIGVGATLDFIAGRVRRAPVLMQRAGMEWIYRVAQEPRRLARRYAGDLIRFVPMIAAQCWNQRGAPRPAARAGTMTLVRTPRWQRLRVTGDFNLEALDRERGVFDEAWHTFKHSRIDLSEVRRIDSTAAAVLVQWRKRLHARGKQLMLLNPGAEVRRTLALMRLTGHFWIVVHSVETPRPVGAPRAGQPVMPPYPGGHTVAWRGEVTASNAEAVWDLTRMHLAAAGPPPHQTFIVDLSRLQFIDSAGVRLMMRLRAWARQLEKDLRFLGTQPDVRNVLRLAKLGSLLEPSPR